MANIYWIHLPEHNDILSEGYIGVSDNVRKRVNSHFKMLKNNIHENIHLSRVYDKYKETIICNIILEGSEDYCYEIENKLRPEKNIGWNIAEGGYGPPKLYGNTHNKGRMISEDHKQAIKNAGVFSKYNKSEAHRLIASKTMKNKPKSEEQKRKQSEKMKANAEKGPVFYCECCNKTIKTHHNWIQHLRSKNHINNNKMYLKEL